MSTVFYDYSLVFEKKKDIIVYAFSFLLFFHIYCQFKIHHVEEAMDYNSLSEEQQYMIDVARTGQNILVDACIGSGKTTSIQVLCNTLNSKRILYLTYNKLLKIDAKEKIKNKNVIVTNYHGFAYMELAKIGVHVGQADLIQAYLRKKPRLSKSYDVLIVDEYQDIEEEVSLMLQMIKNQCPNLQIIAVGDMQQKIYDKTKLDVLSFMDEFLGEYMELSFTKCFRICPDLASELGRIWGKEINGQNRNCVVMTMDPDEVEEYLSGKDIKDILCLGTRNGAMSHLLNSLEEHYPEKFNKSTVYASIQDENKGSVSPGKETAIFTTFDGCKGLERNVCVIFDYTESNWYTRKNIPNQNAEILRNIFCVAASRGKREIVFVKGDDDELLTEEVLSESLTSSNKKYAKPFFISDMFSFKYKEDVEACYSLLSIKKLPVKDRSEIAVKSCDHLIDLAPCIGVFQEQSFFGNYDIDSQIKYSEDIHRNMRQMQLEDDASIEEKILYLTARETGQERYYKQVSIPFITEGQSDLIKDRLRTIFTSSEIVQQDCSIEYLNAKGLPIVEAKGRFDVFKDGKIYELKFVDGLAHEHFLQLACYLVAFEIEKGILWNVKRNEMYEVSVPNKETFLMNVLKAITKDTLDEKKIIAIRLSHTFSANPCYENCDRDISFDEKRKKTKCHSDTSKPKKEMPKFSSKAKADKTKKKKSKHKKK